MSSRKFHKGLIFGKFMPVHQGHLALIDFAVRQCEQLVVSINYTRSDAIEPALRLSWLKILLQDYPAVEVVLEADPERETDQELSLWERTRIWATFIRQRFPDVDAFFCSEEYGEPLAEHLGIPCIYFDKARQQVPVSASQIRQQPFLYWSFIPDVVRPYFTRKVCLYGPESVGKTTLARKLADHYQTVFVPEVARDLITTNEGLTVEDFIRIGQAQTEAVLNAIPKANKVLICDTDLVTTELYAQIYLSVIPDELIALEKQVTYDQHFLLNIDVPWVDDGLRDLGHRRAEVYQLFKEALIQRGINYVDVSGNWQQRWTTVTEAIDRLLLTSY